MFWPGLASIMINDTTLMDAVTRLLQGDRATLAQAMTLIESSHPRHQELSARLPLCLLPVTLCGWGSPERRVPEKARFWKPSACC